jgi:hypothetical protein
MIKKWNTDDIIRQIQTMRWSATDMRMDGFVTWEIKKELYKIKWAADEALGKCSTYVDEEEFLEEHEKETMWNTLNEKTNR